MTEGGSRHVDLFGGEVNFICGLENVFVRVLIELHIAYMSPYIYRQGI